MELDFKKEKNRIGALSDAELLAKLRDPSLGGNDRMLIEAEISRRGLNPDSVVSSPQPVVRKKSKAVPNVISMIVVIGIILSIVAGIMEDMGIDPIEWLMEFFAGRG